MIRPNHLLYMLAAGISVLMPVQAFADWGDEWREEFNNTARSHLEEFEKTAREHFQLIRNNLNDDFLRTLDNMWHDYRVMAGEERPRRQEPVTPPVAPEIPQDKPAPAPIELIPGKINPPVAPVTPTTPIDITFPDNTTPSLPEIKRVMQVDFFGNKCQFVPVDYTYLNVLPEQTSIRTALEKIMADEQTALIVNDCLRLRQSLNLPDMGYIWLVEALAEEVCPGKPNSQAFLATTLLNLSGYDVKIGYNPSGITMLFPTDVLVYATPRLEIKGKDYFVRNRKVSDADYVRSYESQYFKNGADIHLIPDRMPVFHNDGPVHEYSSSKWLQEPEFKINVNEPLVKFLGKYPQISWEYYAQAPLTDEFRNVVIPAVKERTKDAGLNTYDGVRKILSFLHYGFPYKEDGVQFGYEKVNFPDENFYFPYNDCEDRSILFATLVREIYGLDVVLLHYPNHLATAVNFRDPTVTGDYIVVDGENYVVCDPTYIGARIGMSMSQYASVAPEVFKIRTPRSAN